MSELTDKTIGCERCGTLLNTEICTLGEMMRVRFCLRCTNDQMRWYDSLPVWRTIQFLRTTQYMFIAQTTADGRDRADLIMGCYDEVVRLNAELATLTRAWIDRGVSA